MASRDYPSFFEYDDGDYAYAFHRSLHFDLSFRKLKLESEYVCSKYHSDDQMKWVGLANNCSPLRLVARGDFSARLEPQHSEDKLNHLEYIQLNPEFLRDSRDGLHYIIPSGG